MDSHACQGLILEGLPDKALLALIERAQDLIAAREHLRRAGWLDDDILLQERATYCTPCETCQRRIKELEEDVQELKDRLLRTLANMENLKWSVIRTAKGE